MAQTKSRSADDALILKMAQGGATLSEICNATGRTAHRIYARLNRLGAPPLETKGSRLEKQIRQLASEGLTRLEISKRVGRTYDRTSQIISDACIDVVRPPAQQSTFDHSLAIDLYKGGMTGREIASHFGVSRQRVSQVMIRAGLKKTVGRPLKARPSAQVSLAGDAA